MAIRRRVLVDKMALDFELAKCGAIANLVYDRMLISADDAGLCPGNPEEIRGKCFPMIDDITADQIGEATVRLVKARLIYKIDYSGIDLLGFPPDTFLDFQNFRSDYTRRFDYGDMSASVWNAPVAIQAKAKEGFIVKFDDAYKMGEEAFKKKKPLSPRVRKMSQLGLNPSPIKSYVPALEILDAYPEDKRTHEKQTIQYIEKAIVKISKRKGIDDPGVWLRDRVRMYVKSPLCQQTGKDRKYIPMARTWFRDEYYDQDNCVWYSGSVEKPKTVKSLVEAIDKGEVTELDGITTAGKRITNNETGIYFDGTIVVTAEDIEKGKY